MKKWLIGLALLLVSSTGFSQEMIVKLNPSKQSAFNMGRFVLLSRSKKIAPDTYLIDADDSIKDHSEVKWAEPNALLSIPEVRNDAVVQDDDEVPFPRFPLFPIDKNWNLRKVEVDRLFREGHVGDRSIIVAVIDTGVDYNHVALRSKMWTNEDEIPGNEKDDDGNGFVDDVRGWDFANDDNDPMDDHNHGTHCAGTVGGRHVGVVREVTIMPVKFLNGHGQGTLADAVQAIDYAVKNGANILSNSWGGGGRYQSLEEAFKRATDAGIIVVAAAGNSSLDNDRSPSYPANYDGIISVAATTKQDTLASFSNYGAEKVHVAAPGEGIFSSVRNNRYRTFSGTSMATPHIAGIAVHLLERGYEPSDVANVLIQTSDHNDALLDKTASDGRVNAYRAYFGLY